MAQNTEEGSLPLLFIFFFMPFQTVLAGAYFLCNTEARQFIIRKTSTGWFLLLFRRTKIQTTMLPSDTTGGARKPLGPITEAGPCMPIVRNIPETRPHMTIDCGVPVDCTGSHNMPPVSTEDKPSMSVVPIIREYK